MFKKVSLVYNLKQYQNSLILYNSAFVRKDFDKKFSSVSHMIKTFNFEIFLLFLGALNIGLAKKFIQLMNTLFGKVLGENEKCLLFLFKTEWTFWPIQYLSKISHTEQALNKCWLNGMIGELIK